jgi:type IV pilus assembly protein PilM
MNINVVKEGVPMFTRDASIGGSQITKDIQERYELSFEEAEKVKFGEFGKADPKELEDIFVTAANSWSTEVKRAIDFFYATYQEEVIHKMLISGGSARLPGLDKLLSKDTGLPVEILDPLKKIDIDSKTFDPDYIQYVAPQMSIAVGLALRTMEE